MRPTSKNVLPASCYGDVSQEDDTTTYLGVAKNDSTKRGGRFSGGARRSSGWRKPTEATAASNLIAGSYTSRASGGVALIGAASPNSYPA